MRLDQIPIWVLTSQALAYVESKHALHAFVGRLSQFTVKMQIGMTHAEPSNLQTN